jgi:hypothetical protein
MNEVSIIINGVRYDAVESKAGGFSTDCAFYDSIIGCQFCRIGIHACERLIGVNGVFKKSTKSFEP